uniref:Uncharacterized protein n=1 Tax=Ceratitis capitata TaxID=7213 RepID=W8CED5_CERCA
MSLFHLLHNKLITILFVLHLLPPQPTLGASNEYCHYLDGRVFKQICIGLYTATMTAKYMDSKIERLNQYAVYVAEDDPTFYFLAMRISVMHFCKRIQRREGTKFDCLDSGKPEPILLLRADIFCFKYKLDYCEDLVELCELENHRKPNRPTGTKVALLYAMRSILSEAGVGILQPWTKWGLLVLFGVVAWVQKLVFDL